MLTLELVLFDYLKSAAWSVCMEEHP